MNGEQTRTADNVGHEDTNDKCRRLRLALPDHPQPSCCSQHLGTKESDQAVTLPQRPGETEGETPDGPPDVKVEVIKFYLESRLGKEKNQQTSLKMLTDEVSQIQEVRYSLKTLREQMAARQNVNNNKHPANGYRVTVPRSQATVATDNGVHTESESHVRDSEEECVRLREATKRLYTQLKELDKKHKEEVDRLQAENSNYRLRLADQSERLQKAEEQSGERGQQVEELQRMLESMEEECATLKDKMAVGEAELLQLKEEGEEAQEKVERCAELETELAILKEKIHHLDDMLKSQQRKVRHMIEQLQNSRTVIQERDRFIRDLEERVAFLEAENREMHDHMEYFLAGQDPPPMKSTENKPQVIYSKQITPSTHSNKALPFIKVIEIKS
ncbi:tuftelin 1b [Genypterus blacodes]|uniref:tuftelin 1b n=1 Tax=Genypterus blacodes TaxID=154954 RepID=UPI003F767D67